MAGETALRCEEVKTNTVEERTEYGETHENVQKAVDALRSLINYVERRDF